VSSPQLSIDGEGSARTVALAELAEARDYTITVVAEANGGEASATAEVASSTVRGSVTGAGIPEPVLVEEPRARGAVGELGRLESSGTRRLPGRSPPMPAPVSATWFRCSPRRHGRDDPPRERAHRSIQMIDVLAHAERNLCRVPH